MVRKGAQPPEHQRKGLGSRSRCLVPPAGPGRPPPGGRYMGRPGNTGIAEPPTSSRRDRQERRTVRPPITGAVMGGLSSGAKHYGR